ncbi:MAG: hypothetical protein L0Y38_09060 [Methylococcaceae bacterium]|nr:hypothetical protein [Methylococcaceae bacterium]MCI0733954.1 hypothetical protein [Methylococcaceae bacterium]
MTRRTLPARAEDRFVERRSAPETLVEFHYQVSWRSHSAIPGHHYSTQSGGGFEFHGHAPLISHPDPRNLDIHASLNDPFGQFVVRTFRQRSAIPVYVLADLSASMAFTGTRNKHETLAWFSACAAYSAFRTGDPFGFIGCGERIDPNFWIPLRWYKSIAEELWKRLNNHIPNERSARGLLETAALIGRKKSLVFLVSDFHFPLAILNQLLENLETHDVVPVVLWDSREQDHPEWGVIRFSDPESGNSRFLILRPALREKIRAAFRQRRDSITRLCAQFGREPFFVTDAFDPEELTHYFLR